MATNKPPLSATALPRPAVSQDQLFADAQKVLAESRQAWEQEQRKRARGGCLGIFINSIPWWVLIIAIGFFILSASHTANVFTLITPGAGWIAPVPIEVGLLYVAFRRKFAERDNQKVPGSLRSLNWLLFITAILVNAAGGLFETVKSVNVENLPFADLLARYGTLPLTAQAALIVALLAALIVPIGAAVAGEGLASLVFDRQHHGETLDEKWDQVRGSIEREELYKFFTAQGVTPGKAGQLADNYVKFNSSKQIPENKPNSASDAPDQPDKSADKKSEVAKPRQKGAFQSALNWLAQNPNVVNEITVDQLAAQVGVGRSTAGEALKAYRKQLADTALEDRQNRYVGE
jgi:hypothetical protein